MAITMLTSVHSSTVLYLKHYMENNTHMHENDQLLLSYAALGRHKNVEDEVFNYVRDRLVDFIEQGPGANNTTDIIHHIHALGNI